MESEEVGIITSKDEVNEKVYIWAMESRMDFEWPMHDLKTSDWVSVSIKQGQVLNCNKVLDYLPTKRNHQRFKIHTTVLRPPEDWSQRNSYVKCVLSPDFGKVVNSYAIHLSPDVAYEAYVQFDYRLRSQYGTCWFLSKQEAFQSDDQSFRDMMPWSIEVTQEEQGNRSRKPIPDEQMDHLKNHEKTKKVQAQNSNNLDDLWELFGVITTSEISAQECLQPIHASTPAPEINYNLLENERSTSDYRVYSINYQNENLNQHHHQVPSTSFSTLDRNYAHSMNTTEVLDSDLENDLMNFTIQSGSSARLFLAHSMNTTEVLDSDLENDLMNFTIQSGSSASANFTNGPRYGVIVQKIGREKISCYIWTPSDPQLFYHVERPNDRIVIGTWISYEKTRPLCKKNQAAVEWNSQNEACGVQLLNGSLVPTRQAKFGIECMVDIVVQNPDLSPKYVYASNDFFGNQSIIIRRDDYTPRDFSPNKIRRVWIAYARLTNEDDSKWVWQFSEFAENRPRMALPKTLKCDFDSVDAHWQGNNLFVLEPNSNTNIAVFNEFAYGFGASYKQYLRLVKAQAQLEYFGVDEDLSDLNYGVIVRSENRYAIIWSFRENGYVLVPENNQDPRNPEKMIYEIGDWVTYQAYDSSGNDYVECIYREVFVLPELLTQPKIPTIILSFTFMCEVDQLNVVKNKEVVLGSKKFCVAYNDLLGLVLVPHTSTSEEILRRDIAPQAWVLFTNQAYRDYNWYTIYLWNGQRHHYVKLAPAYDLIFDETLKSALKAHLLSERFFGTEEDYYRRYNIKPRFTHLYVSDLLGLVVPNFNENSTSYIFSRGNLVNYYWKYYIGYAR
uniref:Uncharacterized protein n=1 Tax=Acrobeloides nanus TaxID=290746 RepID=A0A914DA68_9BILA